ncbi:hypothetical protein HYFRA_00009206 [Hymenoscyphus fraxineus]|uniref:Ubiquinol-cytochrome c chaperone domain-containing protein n=1 Tax=Hymenoscyphus fraxineus TaxID=746836 RepID=A0A9N9KZ35_9HELO|nr:hypothetical protein HYFRA_00009206 [Hymenoscyphus fraxineus]
MASKSCISCLRTVQRQSQIAPIARNTSRAIVASKAFTTSARRPANTSTPNAAPKVAKPGVTPRKIGGITETYTAYGGTEEMYKECARHANYTIPKAADPEVEMPKTEYGEDLGVGGGWWHDEVGLKPTFSTWSQVTMLHIYLLTVRFRCFPPDVCKTWQQQILNHFFYDMEDKMATHHGMTANGTRQKYLKDIFVQWRGILAAYDEGLAKNDAVLASALWRNIFKADENVDFVKLAQIVSFMRKSLVKLQSMDDLEVMQRGIQFVEPRGEKILLGSSGKDPLAVK